MSTTLSWLFHSAISNLEGYILDELNTSSLGRRIASGHHGLKGNWVGYCANAKSLLSVKRVFVITKKTRLNF